MKFDFIIKNFLIRGFNYYDCGVKVIGKKHFALYKILPDDTSMRYAVYRRFNNKHKKHRGWKIKLKAERFWRYRDFEDFPTFKKAVDDYFFYKDVENVLEGD